MNAFILLNKIYKKMKKAFECLGVYFVGFGISFFCVQKVNDIFYQTVIKGKNITGDNDFKDSLTPKGFFGKSAKATFVKHKIEATKNDESIIYQNFIDRRKNNIDDEEQLKANIFNNLNKKI